MKPSRSISMGFIFLALALVLLIVRLAFWAYCFPPVSADESSFFSPAYSLLTKGTLTTDIHAPFLQGADRHTYWMPPFYMICLALFMKMVGVGFIQAKLFSLLCVLAGTCVLACILRAPKIRLYGSALFLLCPFVLFAAGYARMEALGVLLVILVAWTIIRFEKAGVFFWVGFMSGLACLTHPMGIACAAGGCLAAGQKRFRSLLFFTAGLAIPVLPWLVYICADYHVFIEQFGAQLMRKAAGGPWSLAYLVQVLPLGIIGLLSAWALPRDCRLRSFALGGGIVALLLILKSREFNYQIYQVPYALISLGAWMDRQAEKRSWIALVFMVFFSVMLVGKITHYQIWRYTDAEYRQLVNAVLRNVGDDKAARIFVDGEADVTIPLVMQGFHVERMNAVASKYYDVWVRDYDYVLSARYKGLKKDRPSQAIALIRDTHAMKECWISPHQTYELQVFHKCQPPMKDQP